MLTLNQISPRKMALIYPVSVNELLIVGGTATDADGENRCQQDSYIFNQDQMRVTRKVS